MLDLGCGLGETLALLLEFGYQACGLEPEENFAAEAAARPELSGRIVLGRAQALPFAAASLAALFCECVFSLLPDQEKAAALAEMRRILRPGGWLVLSDLYLRLGAPPPREDLRTEAPRSCLEGAVSLAALENFLIRAGFSPVLVEDHSRALAELAARLIFAGCFPTAPVFGCRGGGVGFGRPGYVLIVARALGLAVDKGVQDDGQ
jgi:SAM-dependent methyltransferase